VTDGARAEAVLREGFVGLLDLGRGGGHMLLIGIEGTRTKECLKRWKDLEGGGNFNISLSRCKSLLRENGKRGTLDGRAVWWGLLLP